MEAHQRLLPTPLPGTDQMRPEPPQPVAAGHLMARSGSAVPPSPSDPAPGLTKADVARPKTGRERRSNERVAPAKAGRNPQPAPLQPREPIDADLIAKAIAPQKLTPQARPQEQQAGSEFDKDGLQRALGGYVPDRRMGLGVRP